MTRLVSPAARNGDPSRADTHRLARLDEPGEGALRRARRDARVLREDARGPEGAVAEQEREARAGAFGRRHEHEDLARGRERVALDRRDGLDQERDGELAKAPDLDAEARPVRGVDGARLEGDSREIVARDGRRPRARERVEQGEEDRAPRQRDDDAAGAREPPARVDEEAIAARSLLDREEVRRVRLASSQDARDGPRELLLERRDRAPEERVRRAVQQAPRLREGAHRLPRRDRADGDLGLGEQGDGAHVRPDLPARTARHLGDHRARLAQPAEQHVGARDDEALHGGVAVVAERAELVGAGDRVAQGARRIAARERDLRERRAGPRAPERVLERALCAVERGLRQVEVAELGVGDTAERERVRAALAPDEAQGEERLATEEGARRAREDLAVVHARRIDRRAPRVSPCVTNVTHARRRGSVVSVKRRSPMCCPACLSVAAVTVVTTTGAGAAATAFVVGVVRALKRSVAPMMPMSTAEIVREESPIDHERIHGVTFDGKLVWFARDDEIVAYDPEASTVVRRIPVPGARAGTAFDGEHLYQLAGDEIFVVRPSDGATVRRMPAPGKSGNSGMAYADGHLFVGNGPGAKIHKIEAKTGALVSTLSSDRFVTGVSCVGGALWHGVSTDGKTPELRRLGPDGTVEAAVPVPVEHIAGVEGTGDGTFWCAGERGKLRLVRAARKAARAG